MKIFSADPFRRLAGQGLHDMAERKALCPEDPPGSPPEKGGGLHVQSAHNRPARYGIPEQLPEIAIVHAFHDCGDKNHTESRAAAVSRAASLISLSPGITVPRRLSR